MSRLAAPSSQSNKTLMMPYSVGWRFLMWLSIDESLSRSCGIFSVQRQGVVPHAWRWVMQRKTMAPSSSGSKHDLIIARFRSRRAWAACCAARRRSSLHEHFETCLQQLLAGVARPCKPTGGRHVGQPQHEERLQLRRQLEQGQDHVAAAEVATCCRNVGHPGNQLPALPSYPVRKIN